MKKLILAGLACVTLTLSACADPKVINGKEYQPYGFANEQTRKDPNIVYEIPAANWIVGIVFSETLLVPGYIIGWDLFEPVGVKSKDVAKTAVVQ
jgi:hypothetical protein